MPELQEQMYCSEQITIPPPFPYLLRHYAKAAIRTQPTDLLKWSTAYFRCLSLNIPPPVKPRLEYPIPRDYYGLTPGWLKALIYQLQNNQTISFKVLWDRWTGACLQHDTLIKILCLGGFDNPQAIPWLRFVGICAAHLTENLTHSMTMICEILTEEPEGGSAIITLETFVDLYTFLAALDASNPQKLKNLYFTDSLLSLLRDKSEKDEKLSQEKAESIQEEESVKDQISEQSIEVEEEKAHIKEEVSCPSLGEDDTYSINYDAEPVTGEDGPSNVDHEYLMGEAEEIGEEESETEKKGDDSADKVSEEQGSEESENIDDVNLALEEQESGDNNEEHIDKILVNQTSEVPEASPTEEKASEELEPEIVLSKDTIQEEPRTIGPDYLEDETTLLEDLERLKALQHEVAGETDEEVEKYKCRLIEEMPLSQSQKEAIQEFQDVEEEKSVTEEQEKQEIEETVQEVSYEEVYVDAIPGIGPTVPAELVEAVCKYMKSVASIQHGMVMPRNIRHYNCPPLEILDY